jgi:four helix bundle protein
MSELPHAKSYQELIVYQKARRLAQEIFELSKYFPREEAYSLTDQIRRSSRSIGAQIAEAWAKRRYEKHFVSKLTDADGEQQETRHWIDVALDCKYIEQSQATDLKNKTVEIGRILGGMMAKSESFCRTNDRSIREEQAEYFTKSN